MKIFRIVVALVPMLAFGGELSTLREVGQLATRKLPSAAFASNCLYSALGTDAADYLTRVVVKNARSLFDGDTIPQGVERLAVGGRTLSVATFMRRGIVWRFCWLVEAESSEGVAPVAVNLLEVLKDAKAMKQPTMTDLLTGKIYEVVDLRQVPMGNSPVLIAEKFEVPFATDWWTMKGAEIVDCWFRRFVRNHRMKAFPEGHEGEEWMDWPAEKFLPCIDRFGQFKWRDWPGKTRSEEDLKSAAQEEEQDLAEHPSAADRNKFGGWTKGPKLAATGRFRTHRDGKGKWWLVDPEGRYFWSFGPVRVSASNGMTPMNGDKDAVNLGFALPDRDCFFEELPACQGSPMSKFWTTHDELLWPFYLVRGETRVYDFSSANLYRKYGEDYYAHFAALCHRRLKSWGMNTIANSSDLEICLMDRTPYAERVEVKGSVEIAGSWGQWGKFRDPWDEGFVPTTVRALEQHGREAHDPWCIGFFVDNEIQWGKHPTDLARWTLKSPATQAAKIAAVDFFKAKYGEIAALNAKWGANYASWEDLLGSMATPGEGANDDLEEFTGVICEEYFRRTREAVKKVDPKLLYLGCRFAKAPIWALRPSVKYCDVVSYNIYEETLDDWQLPEKLDAPVMCGEFHFGATDRGPFGSGVLTAKNQQERAAKMKRYTESALRNPQLVGVHWHQFSDQATTGRFDGEYQQVGLTDICDRPYPIMRQALREVGYSMYETRENAARMGK